MFRYTQKARFERVFMGPQYRSIHPLIKSPAQNLTQDTQDTHDNQFSPLSEDEE